VFLPGVFLLAKIKADLVGGVQTCSRAAVHSAFDRGSSAPPSQRLDLDQILQRWEAKPRTVDSILRAGASQRCTAPQNNGMAVDVAAGAVTSSRSQVDCDRW